MNYQNLTQESSTTADATTETDDVVVVPSSNQAVVQFNDQSRRRRQIQINSGNENSSVNGISENQRKQTIICYFIGLALFIATPFHSCDEAAGKASVYSFNIKDWIVIWVCISISSLGKFFLF